MSKLFPFFCDHCGKLVVENALDDAVVTWQVHPDTGAIHQIALTHGHCSWPRLIGDLVKDPSLLVEENLTKLARPSEFPRLKKIVETAPFDVFDQMRRLLETLYPGQVELHVCAW